MIGVNNQFGASTIGMHFSTYGNFIKTDGRLVLNPAFDRSDNFKDAFKEGTLITEGELSAGCQIVDEGWLTLEYLLYRPVFMADSIFNIFGIIPKRDLGVRFEKAIGDKLSVSSWGFVRFVMDNYSKTAETSPLLGAGGGTGANYFYKNRSFSIRLTGQKELDSSRIGIETGGSHGFLNETLWLGYRCSFWHTDDQLISYGYGNIAGYAATLKYNISEAARVLGEFENYFGGGRDPRVVLFMALQLDLWL
jgi:hypothetical protein